MNRLKESLYDKFEKAATEAEYEALRHSIMQGERILQRGYSSFSDLLLHLRMKLRSFEDGDTAELLSLIDKARVIFPEPGRISPSWEYVWDELGKIILYKQDVLQSVPPDQRAGEWQVIMDNPYTHEERVCYPGLAFVEGAYLYSYFRLGLKKNEYVRLQKVESVIISFGS